MKNQFNFTVNSKQIIGDLQTPIGVYLKVRNLYPQSCLLESTDLTDPDNSYSYIGIQPLASIRIDREKVFLHYPDSDYQEEILQGKQISDTVHDFTQQFSFQGEHKELCNLFGYTSYRIVHSLFNLPNYKDSLKENTSDLHYILYKYVIRFNPINKEILLIELTNNEESQLDQFITIIENRNFSCYNFFSKGAIYSTTTDSEQKNSIQKGIALCKEGKINQLVLSRSFKQKFEGDDFKVYRALRNINPSPYLFYFDFGSYRIFGSSPETHCKIEKGEIHIDPIAGTVARGDHEEEDKKAVEFLLNDSKENIEHDMLVNLVKRELDELCDKSKLIFYKRVQKYSHVIHLVSRIRGKLKKELSPIEAYFRTFPAGTVSGFPKKEAIALLREIEQEEREVYGGSIGSIGFNGEVNQAIVIRTFISQNNELSFQAGSGIVAQSSVENEFKEVDNKLKALQLAIQAANELKD